MVHLKPTLETLNTIGRGLQWPHRKRYSGTIR